MTYELRPFAVSVCEDGCCVVGVDSDYPPPVHGEWGDDDQQYARPMYQVLPANGGENAYLEYGIYVTDFHFDIEPPLWWRYISNREGCACDACIDRAKQACANAMCPERPPAKVFVKPVVAGVLGLPSEWVAVGTLSSGDGVSFSNTMDTCHEQR